MTTKPLPQFWKALDVLPGAATDRRDWSLRLDAELAAVQRYLRKTGKLATAVECPSPGGDGCPRAVIRRPTNGFRAVCRSSAGQCDTLELTGADIAIVELDRHRLYEDLASIFCTSSASTTAARGRVVHLGEHAVSAGVAAPVFFLMPGPDTPVTDDEMRDSGLGHEQAVLLVPTAASLTASARARLSSRGHQMVSLLEVTAVNAQGRLTAGQPVEALLHTVRGTLRARLDEVSTGVQVALPPGTTWGQISFRLTSTATVICNGPGIHGRQIDPGNLGMRSAKNSKPTLAWVFFVMMAEGRGTLAPHSGQPIGRLRKQKQALSERMRATFGIDADPIVWDSRQHAYVTAFTVSDERSKTELAAQRRR